MHWNFHRHRYCCSILAKHKLSPQESSVDTILLSWSRDTHTNSVHQLVCRYPRCTLLDRTKRARERHLIYMCDLRATTSRMWLVSDNIHITQSHIHCAAGTTVVVKRGTASRQPRNRYCANMGYEARNVLYLYIHTGRRLVVCAQLLDCVI